MSRADLALMVGRTLTVEEVIKWHEALDGQVFRIKGRVTRCQPYSCALLSLTNDQKALSLGGSDMFDREVSAFENAATLVEVEGRVSRTCFDHTADPGHPKVTVVCLDRADEIQHPRLIRIFT